MSRECLALLGCLVLATSTALLIAGSARTEEGRETSSRDVSLDEIPDAARRTVLEQAGEHRIRELEEKVVDGKTVYEAELRIDGKEVEVVVAPDGRVVWIKGDGSEARGAAVAGSREDDEWRQTFDVDKNNLGTVGRNPYFPLEPGLKVHLAKEGETLVVSVLDETKVVDGVTTRVVEERESDDRGLVEISKNYYAVDKATGDVYYFGEDVEDYEDGKVVGHGGAWLSGVDGAKFGLMMPGKPSVGDKYYFEMAPGATERAEIVDLDATLETPLKTFSDVVYCREYDLLDSEVSHKWYAAGIGMIGDDDLRVIRIEEPTSR
jgi:hypothetical protein